VVSIEIAADLLPPLGRVQLRGHIGAIMGDCSPPNKLGCGRHSCCGMAMKATPGAVQRRDTVFRDLQGTFRPREP
jgi:hypothetical protein